MMRKIRWAAYGLLLAVLAFWATLWLRGDMQNPVAAISVQVPGNVAVGGPFTLVDSAGRTVTDADFRGRWMLVYFGYTFCPDVCPTELQTVTSALDLLGPLAEKVAPLFITVDPERDTVPVMADYVKLFGPRLVGLTGSPAQVAAAARAYRVYFAKSTPKETSEYLMDHSSFLYLMGPDGRFRALFRQGTSAQELADSIRARLSAAS
jgi:protein SCO1/2